MRFGTLARSRPASNAPCSDPKHTLPARVSKRRASLVRSGSETSTSQRPRRAPERVRESTSAESVRPTRRARTQCSTRWHPTLAVGEGSRHDQALGRVLEANTLRSRARSFHALTRTASECRCRRACGVANLKALLGVSPRAAPPGTVPSRHCCKTARPTDAWSGSDHASFRNDTTSLVTLHDPFDVG